MAVVNPQFCNHGVASDPPPERGIPSTDARVSSSCRCCSAAAPSAIYVLTAADVDKTVKARARFTDGRHSRRTPTVPPAAGSIRLAITVI